MVQESEETAQELTGAWRGKHSDEDYNPCASATRPPFFSFGKLSEVSFAFRFLWPW